MSDTKPPNLIQKLAAIMAQVKHVPKRGRNEHFNYAYATEADICDVVRDAMAERGVMMYPNVEKAEWRQVSGQKGPQNVVTLTVKFTVTDGVDKLEFVVLGEGQDNGDKNTYKAMTGATKYALLKLFLIPTGDDPEKEDAPAKSAPAASRTASVKETLKQAQNIAAEKAGETFILRGKKYGGKGLHEVTDMSYFTWLASSMNASLTDPAKAQYKEQTERELRMVEARIRELNNVNGEAH